uniref:AlNc14C73G4953 protein n=1 Tax=Albugo laibachii Nc14 TaxID=890382 RepID=F0WE96_9STRA|nr:AlNc14C73G4953 [Albugo laibachii Nc14]|eukprot:CCA19527.1 AlNc14C73G4953 [Albugo laibachii Nc14]
MLRRAVVERDEPGKWKEPATVLHPQERTPNGNVTEGRNELAEAKKNLAKPNTKSDKSPKSQSELPLLKPNRSTRKLGVHSHIPYNENDKEDMEDMEDTEPVMKDMENAPEVIELLQRRVEELAGADNIAREKL